MKKQADYTQCKANRDQWLLEKCLTEGSSQRKDISNMIEHLICAANDLHGQAVNEERKIRVTEDYYHMLCKLARINGGRVELDWNEQCPIATLTYWGEELTLDRDFSSEWENFSSILRDCDTVNFSAEGKNFKLLMSFDLRNPNSPKLYALK